MSDIFISYNNKDKAKAELFARIFEREGWSVFWDKAIPPGKAFDQYINEQLEAAKCIVVLWSEGSVNSDWVKEEAQRGVQGKILVPVFINKVAPPLGFGRIEAAELFDWEGDTSEIEFQNLLKAMKALIRPSKNPPVPAPSIPPSKPRSIKNYMLSGLAALVILVILFFIWQRGGDIRVVSDPSKSLPAETGEGWGVVFGSDMSIDAARDEITRASAKGIPTARLYLRNGYYASIAVVDSRSTAQELLAIARTFRSDAYIASMETWCRNSQPRDGFVECLKSQ